MYLYHHFLILIKVVHYCHCSSTLLLLSLLLLLLLELSFHFGSMRVYIFTPIDFREEKLVRKLMNNLNVALNIAVPFEKRACTVHVLLLYNWPKNTIKHMIKDQGPRKKALCYQEKIIIIRKERSSPYLWRSLKLN